MQSQQSVQSQHDDFIHDVVYDFYGKRMASCSADKHIKVWHLDDNEQWTKDSEIREAHKNAVWKLAWAHPEFGQVLASCSADWTVCIWEEREGGYTEEGKDDTRRWVKRADLSDGRGSVTDVKFAPHHVGLQLATASDDNDNFGVVRIYEAGDVINLTSWQLQSKFKACKHTVTCLSWCPSRFCGPMLAVGCNSPDQSGEDGMSDGNNAFAKIWAYDSDTRKWHPAVDLGDSSVSQVHDIAWAPDVGRSFHLVAVACKEALCIWKLKSDPDTGKWDAELKCLSKTDEQHPKEVWRVEWNVTGTVLASSGDDGVVRLWRSDFKGNWTCVSKINGT